MAKVILNHILEKFKGEMVKRSGIIFRKKSYRFNGKVISEGDQECYKVTRPRDFKQTPPQGNEKKNFDLWKEVCRRASEEIKPEHERYGYWQERWEKQLTKPDPAILPNKKKKKIQSYSKFDCFVRVAIRSELVAAASGEGGVSLREGDELNTKMDKNIE